MPLSYTQSFDGVTAPAVPSGWNVDATYTTSTSASVSSPNSLKSPDNTSVFKWATYGTSDDTNGSEISLSAWVQLSSSGVSGTFDFGLTYRCNGSTMNNTSTRCYAILVITNPLQVTSILRLVSINNGTPTTVSSLTVNEQVCGNGWYKLFANITANSHVFRLQRNDGNWLDSSGNFNAALSNAISVSDSTYATGNYYGFVTLAPSLLSTAYYDDFSISTTPSGLLRVTLDGLNRYANLGGGMLG